MARYEVNFTDLESGKIYYLDDIEERDGYTAEDYVRDYADDLNNIFGDCKGKVEINKVD